MDEELKRKKSTTRSLRVILILILYLIFFNQLNENGKQITIITINTFLIISHIYKANDK